MKVNPFWNLQPTQQVSMNYHYLLFFLTLTFCSFGQKEKSGLTVNDTLVYDTKSVEVKPEFPGANMESMFAFFRKNFIRPQKLGDEKITKKAFVQFVVEKDGSISNIKMIRGIGPVIDQEIVRVLKAMPKWLPAELNGYHVRCLFAVPFIIPTDD